MTISIMNILINRQNCRLQGRSHSIGMCMTYPFDAIHVWNRTKSTADALARELELLRPKFQNPSITVLCFDAIEHCVRNADVIVTATFASTPLITRAMIKRGAHINGECAHTHFDSDQNDATNSNVQVMALVGLSQFSNKTARKRNW